MKRIIKNGSILFFEEIIFRALNFLATMIIVRTLSKEHFGILVTASAILNYAVVVASMGLKNIGFIATSTPKEKRTLQLEDIFSVKVTLALIVWVISSIVLFILPLPALLKTVFLIYMGNLLFEGLYLDWYYRGIAAFKKIATTRVITAFLYTGSVSILLQKESSLVGVALIFLSWNLLQALVLLFQSKLFKIRLANLATLKEVLHHALPVGGGTLLLHLPLLLPPLLLIFFHSAAHSAEYSAAFRIIMLIKIIDPVVSNLYLSSFPKMWNSSHELAIRQVNRVVLGLTTLFALIILLLSPLSSFITSLIYGEKYGSEPVLLPIFGFFILGTILNTIISLGIIAITDNRRYFHASVIATLVALPLMFLLIIPLGTVGAALALVVAEWSITIFSYRVFREFVPLKLTPLLILIGATILGTVFLNVQF